MDVQSTEVMLLNTDEIGELDRLETVIQQGLQTFVDVGTALMEINEKRLWRQTHDSFAEYCRQRWDIGQSRAYQLMGAAQTANLLSTIVEMPQPQNEAQVRALSQLAPELRPEAWRRAVAKAPDGQVTIEHTRAVVDEMLGKRGRFDGKLWYPVWPAKRLIFNDPKGKHEDLYNVTRYAGLTYLQGKDLNGDKKYDGYSLVEVPELHVADLAVALPGFETMKSYPVDLDKKIIYDAPYSSYRMQPENTYAGCDWIRGWDIKREWDSIIRTFGEFQVAPARPISTDWLAHSPFQPGMVARCPLCGASWAKEQATQPYEQWAAIEPKFWACPQGHRIEDAKLIFLTTELPGLDKPQAPTAPVGAGPALPQGDADDPDEDEDEDTGPDEDDLEEILDWVVALDELLTSIRDRRAVVDLALAEDRVKGYRRSIYNRNHDQPTDDAIQIVRKWLEQQ